MWLISYSRHSSCSEEQDSYSMFLKMIIYFFDIQLRQNMLQPTETSQQELYEAQHP